MTIDNDQLDMVNLDQSDAIDINPGSSREPALQGFLGDGDEVKAKPNQRKSVSVPPRTSALLSHSINL